MINNNNKPRHHKVEDIMAYVNRHGCWGLVVLAGCHFTMFSCKNCGSTNDSIVWDMSALKWAIDAGLLPEDFLNW